jgi:hypothetical protein
VSEAAGWLPDPEVPGRLRYWDGTQWTDHRHDPTAAAGRTEFDEARARSIADHLVGRARRTLWPEMQREVGPIEVVEHPEEHRAAVRAALGGLAELLRPGETLVFVDAVADHRDRAGAPSLRALVTGLTDRRALAVAVSVAYDAAGRTTREFDDAPLAAVEVRPGSGDRLALRWAPGTPFTFTTPDPDEAERVRQFLASPGTRPFTELEALLALPLLDPAQPPPDWYPIPDGGELHRWWDGERWTDDTAVAGARFRPAGSLRNLPRP